MGTVVLCVAFLAMAAALAAGSGLNITVCRVVFYAGSGIFAVFYLSLFIWLAAYMRVPQLWAGMGKVISNVVALVVTIPSAALAQANDQALTSLAFVLFAAVLILMTRAGMLAPDYEERISSYSEKSTDAEETPDHESAEKPDQESPEQASPRSPEEALAAFCESYGLTSGKATFSLQWSRMSGRSSTSQQSWAWACALFSTISPRCTRRRAPKRSPA